MNLLFSGRLVCMFVHCIPFSYLVQNASSMYDKFVLIIYRISFYFFSFMILDVLIKPLDPFRDYF